MKLLLNQGWVKDYLSDNKITVIDGGARGSLFPPFNKLDKSILTVIRFEPDSDAELSISENEILVKSAVWNKKANLKLHIANAPAASSVYPPDMDWIKQLNNNPTHIHQRETNKIVSVEAESIDEMRIDGTLPPIDFIKLDVHGSEYEIIDGARKSMQNEVMGVLAETWTAPLHKNQKTHGEFAALLNQLDFYLFDQLKMGVAKRNVKGSNFHKHTPINFDSLYFKNVLNNKTLAFSSSDCIKYIGLADLFGHYGYALQLANHFYESDLIEEEFLLKLTKFIKSQNDFKVKYGQKIIDFIANQISRFS